MSGQPYQRHYEVGLLDDIHNYFPALLYEPERFSSVADVLSYVRQSVARRFDLFSAGQRGYDAAAFAPAQPPQLPPQGPQPFAASPIQPPRGGFGSARRQPQPPATEIQIEVEEYAPRAAQRAPMPGIPLRASQMLFPTEIESAASDILNLLNPNSTTPAFSPLSLLSLFNSLNTVNAGAGGGAAAANFMDPVPVRPTAAQISDATALETVDAEEEVCAICQDIMEPGSESRVINHCDHRFHPGCIDTWFQRDVHCPVCRHDIRAAAAGQN